jgi:hypothetical protein
MRRVLTIRASFLDLVAGEAEEMASIVHKFMHIHAWKDRRGTFLDTDKVNRQKQNSREN